MLVCGGLRVVCAAVTEGRTTRKDHCQAKILALTSALNEDEPSLAQADAGEYSYPCDSLWEVPKVRAAARF